MSSIFTVDHHATLDRTGTASNDKPDCWPRRRSAGFIVIAALASWILVLSPFFLFG